MSRENARILNPKNAMAFAGMAPRPIASADLKAVRVGIGAELRTQLSDVLHEPIPNEMAELLKRLDEQTAKRSEN